VLAKKGESAYYAKLVKAYTRVFLVFRETPFYPKNQKTSKIAKNAGHPHPTNAGGVGICGHFNPCTTNTGSPAAPAPDHLHHQHRITTNTNTGSPAAPTPNYNHDTYNPLDAILDAAAPPPTPTPDHLHHQHRITINY